MRREYWEEQEKKEEREGQEERDETTKGKEATAYKGKKLRKGRLICRNEGAKGFIKRLDVLNSTDQQKATSPWVKSCQYCSCTEWESEN